MNKEELLSRLCEIKKRSEDKKDNLYCDGEGSHVLVDKLLYEYIGFTAEEQEIINELCPWCA